MRNVSMVGDGGGGGVTLMPAEAGPSTFCRVLSISRDVVTLMSNLRITGGYSNLSAPIFNEGVLTMISCVIDSNIVAATELSSPLEVGGGGLSNMESGIVTMRSSRVVNNTIYSYFLGGGGLFNAGSLSLHGCLIDGNTASNGEGLEAAGGGVQNTGALLLNGTRVESNTGWNGAGLSNGVLGISLLQTSATVLRSCIAHNTAGNNGGGAISFCPMIMSGCQVHHNSATGDGGGLVNTCGSGFTCGLMEVSQSEVFNNSAGRGAGGLLNNPDSSSADPTVCALILHACNVRANSATSGGGLQNMVGGLLLLEFCLIEKNRLVNTSFGDAFAGGGLYNAGSGVLHMTIIQENIVSAGATGASMYNGGELMNILPLPRGRYVDGVFECRLLKCYDGTSVQQHAEVDCPIQPCDHDTWGALGLSMSKVRPFTHHFTPPLPSTRPHPAQPTSPHSTCAPSPCAQPALSAACLLVADLSGCG